MARVILQVLVVIRVKLVEEIRDYWLVKIDAAGNKLWDKTFGGTGVDDLRSIVPSADGGYLLGGGSSESGIGGDKSEAK